jgi:hypothetical protein
MLLNCVALKIHRCKDFTFFGLILEVKQKRSIASIKNNIASRFFFNHLLLVKEQNKKFENLINLSLKRKSVHDSRMNPAREANDPSPHHKSMRCVKERTISLP